MSRFHRLANDTLQRTNAAFFGDEFGRAFSWLLFGAIPIVGLLSLGWSAREWLIFLLIGAWTGILCDFCKLRFLYRQVMTSAQTIYDDNFVWTVVDSLRVGNPKAPRDHLRASYKPGSGVFVDIVFGGIGSALAVTLFPEDLLGALTDIRSLQLSVGAFIGYRLLFTVWEIVEQRRRSTADRVVRVAVGLRGVGLFMLGFAIAFLCGDEQKPALDGGSLAWWLMIVVNALMIFVSLLNLWGLIMIGSNRRWLARYLVDRPAQND